MRLSVVHLFALNALCCGPKTLFASQWSSMIFLTTVNIFNAVLGDYQIFSMTLSESRELDFLFCCSLGSRCQRKKLLKNAILAMKAVKR